jgi:hypothetical protein
MKLAATYSHLNGLEWLLHHHSDYWDEVCDAIASVDASLCKTKVSQEQTMLGRMLYSPKALNTAFRNELRSRKWARAVPNTFYVTDDADLTKQLLKLDVSAQKKLITSSGKTHIRTSNSADFEKGRVSIEVQFGKYSFVQFDLFIKHAANYMQDKIDLGIEIVPMKVMEAEMSSGPPYYEKHLHEIMRQGRIFPPVPLILVGVAP